MYRKEMILSYALFLSIDLTIIFLINTLEQSSEKKNEENVCSYLITPFIDDRHVDVIYKYSHPLPCSWPERVPHSLVDVRFDRSLQEGNIYYNGENFPAFFKP